MAGALHFDGNRDEQTLRPGERNELPDRLRRNSLFLRGTILLLLLRLLIDDGEPRDFHGLRAVVASIAPSCPYSASLWKVSCWGARISLSKC